MKKYWSGFVFLFFISVLIPSAAVAEFMMLALVTDSWGGKLIKISLGPDGADVGSQAVTFSITPDDGTASLSATSAETDSDGDVSVRVDFENNASGSYEVTISIGTQSFDVPVSPPPLLLSMECDNSNPEPGGAVTFTLSAVRGPFMAKGYTVTFSVTPDDGTASLSSTSETTGVSGRVKTKLTFGSDASGVYTVTASVGDISVNGTVEVETALISQQQQLQPPTIIPITDPPFSQQQAESVPTQQQSDSDLIRQDSQTVPQSTLNSAQQDTKTVTQEATNPVPTQQESRIVPRSSVKRPKPKPTGIRPSPVAQDRIIFNEIRNASDDTDDWLEIRNISDTDIPIDNWEISIVTRDGEKANLDIDFVDFPEYILPAGGILLIVNTDPSETSLVEGYNIEIPDAEQKTAPLYLLEETFKLPSTPYLLILRSATDKNGEPEAFEDVMGNHFRQFTPYNTQVWPLQGTARYDWLPSPLTPDEAWRRVDIEKRGYIKEAWASSEYQNGVGYEPSASVETSVGTPGYPNDTVVDLSLAGRITFSELMYATGGGLFSLSQWIELCNNTATAAEPVNLEGWKLVIEARDSETRHRYSEITLEALEIASTETVLLITRNRRHSGHLSEDQVYDLYEHHSNAHKLGLRENAVLSASGFSLQLYSPDGVLVDSVGNLDGEKGVDEPLWELPSGWTEDGARTSLLRGYEDGVTLSGTESTSWYRAADVDFPLELYYGHKTDLGTPGYMGGGSAPVMLSHFSSERVESGVIIEWTTVSETDNAGFNIFRSDTKKGHYVKVNPRLILGAGTTPEQHTYSWTDTTARPNVAYYYQIEDVSFSGNHRRIATVRMRGHVSANGKLLQTWGDLKKRN